MADDPKKPDSQDRTRINLSEEHEVQYWSERVGLTPERLREVVNEVGNSVERVREKLGWQKIAMAQVAEPPRPSAGGFWHPL